jgi:hypothetical protein
LSNYHIDKNLIVIGYSGRDKSLMDALKSAFTVTGAGRLYWCGYGNNASEEVLELISQVREAGREAYYIATDGFDKTLIHLAKSAFEGNQVVSKAVQEALESSGDEVVVNTDFSLDFVKTDKYMKSNLHPIAFPKEVFQFEIEFHSVGLWDFILERTSGTDICAVPFKNKIFALGTLTDISKVFNDILKSDIRREPISKDDVEKVSAFKPLMLQAILKYLSINNSIETNLKNTIWIKSPDSKQADIDIHKAVHVSFWFDKNKNFAYVSIIPNVHLSSKRNISKEERQLISKSYLEKLFNNKYDEILGFWNKLLFNNQNLKFEYPPASGTGFEFKINSGVAFSEINVLNSNFSSYHPRDYDKRQTLFKGVQFLEPQLIFKNINSSADFKDYHPMRGLVSNRPFDVNLNGNIYSNEINIVVICGAKYSDKLYNFLSALNVKHSAGGINPDYLIDYPGFVSAFNIPINIPHPGDTNRWLGIDFENEEYLGIPVNAVKLARIITSKVEQIANTQGQNTVVVLIPREWQAFEKYTELDETFDLHDYMKAFSASKGISTQIIREKTLEDALKCQIYWWLSLSFYVKSLRTPWILNSQEKNTAYAGIGYSITKGQDKSEIVIGCSHLYDSNGQGLKYKLSKVDNYFLDSKRNPYLSYKDAFQFGVSIRELFYQSLDKIPERVVIHKTTRFTEDEINGIKASLNKAGIKKIDLVEISFEPDVKFIAMNVYQGDFQVDGFPISRGTCIVTDKHTALLWTHGIVPSVKEPRRNFYLGGRSIPAPVKIVKHHGESNISILANEILGLTKMNWNSLDLYSKLPSTIASSNQIARIGKLLSRFEGQTYDYRFFI